MLDVVFHVFVTSHFSYNSQITVIGRYGSTNARAKIPLGFYYGHTYILPWESELKLMHDPLRGESEAASQPDVDQHLTMMVALQEDIQCRYDWKKINSSHCNSLANLPQTGGYSALVGDYFQPCINSHLLLFCSCLPGII